MKKKISQFVQRLRMKWFQTRLKLCLFAYTSARWLGTQILEGAVGAMIFILTQQLIIHAAPHDVVSPQTIEVSKTGA